MRPIPTIFVGDMPFKASFFKKTFHFSFQARTSRGTLASRDSWFLKVWDERHPEVFGLGEAGPLPGLSVEKPEDVERELEGAVHFITKDLGASDIQGLPQIHDFLKGKALSSSVLFALETALLDLKHAGVRTIFENQFKEGKSIPINGLVWMGGLDFMLQQVSIKLEEGFTCIKLKVGSLNFEKELDILQFIRRKYFRDVIAIRLDANGAFKPEQALFKITDCSRYDVHSIEQPLKAGSPMLPELVRQSPVPVALDEELIGVIGQSNKVALLERIKPHFIILKPSLHGGLAGVEEWITLAQERKVGWWITSALESTIGLNAIAQFTSNHDIILPQGLGTGSIYTDNIPSPLVVRKGALIYDSQENWDLSALN